MTRESRRSIVESKGEVAVCFLDTRFSANLSPPLVSILVGTSVFFHDRFRVVDEEESGKRRGTQATARNSRNFSRSLVDVGK